MFKEYPKWIDSAKLGKRVIVATVEEEAAHGVQVVEQSTETAPIAAAEKSDADERAELLAQAESGGIKVDRRWGIDRLREAVNGNDSA